MVLVIGQEGCSKCEEKVKELENSNTPFLYFDFNKMDKETQSQFLNLRHKYGIKSFKIPLILKDGKLYDIDE